MDSFPTVVTRSFRPAHGIFVAPWTTIPSPCLNLVVETGPWYACKRILISTSAVQNISYLDAKVVVKLTRADIQRTREDEVAMAALA